jgi:Secretion system C-terminal sorting domain
MQQFFRHVFLLLCFTLATSFYATAQCNIDGTVTNKRCNDNGTTTADDDTFTFDFTGIGTGSNGYDVFVGNFNGKGGWNYFGQSVQLGPFSIKNGNVTLIVAVNGNANCYKTITVTPTAVCSCDINYIVSNNQCNDNGTPCDASDDTFTFEVMSTGTGSNGYDLFLNDWNGKQYWNYFGEKSKLGPFKIKDGNVNLIIARNGDANCNKKFAVTPPTACSKYAVCDAGVIVSSPVAYSNGTECDDKDDYFAFDITATGNYCNTDIVTIKQSTGTRTFIQNGGVKFSSNALQIAAGDATVTVTRNGYPNCFATTVVKAPAAPSKYAKCDAGVTVSAIACNNNNTECDETDDTYNFIVQPTGNFCQGATIEIQQKNSNYRYIRGGSLANVAFYPVPLKIANGDVTIVVYRTDVPSCKSEIYKVTAPNACSKPKCDIGATIANTICNNNGTECDITDDTYTFDVTTTGKFCQNAIIVIKQGNNTQTFGRAGGVTFTSEPLKTTGGNATIIVYRDEGRTCASQVYTVTAPYCGPKKCKLTSAEVCFIRTDYQGQEPSPFDTRDDQYQFLLKVMGDTTGATKYQVYVDNRLYVESAVGQSYWFRFPISKGDFNISVKEVGNICCDIIVPVKAPKLNRSVNPCNISAYITNISCDPLSTRDYPGDDKFTFDVQAYDGSMFGDPNYEVYITSYTQSFYNFYYGGGSEGTNWNGWSGGWKNVGTTAFGSKVSTAKQYIRDFGAGTKLAVVVARKSDLGCFRLYTLDVPSPCSLNPARKANNNDLVESAPQVLNAEGVNIAQKIAASNPIHSLVIYPNPAHARIMVETAGWSDEVIGKIINMEGKIMQQILMDGNSRTEINISDLVPGIYLLQLNNGTTTKSEKLIVK